MAQAGSRTVDRCIAFAKRWGLFALLLWSALAVAAMALSERLIFLPPAPSYRDRPDTLRLRTADGGQIAAVFLPQPGPAQVILFSHGNAEDLGYARPDLERLYALGFSVLAYDYRGYGTSSGAPSEKASYLDIDAAYDHLTIALKVPPGRIIAYGRSLGGGPSVDLASRRPLGALILESTFVSAFRVVTRWPLVPFDRFRNAAKLPRVTCPVLVMHGTRDTVVPYWHGLALHDAANDPKRFWRAEGAGHMELMDAPGYEQVVTSFVREAGSR